jgi:hypothetical protein
MKILKIATIIYLIILINQNNIYAFTNNNTIIKPLIGVELNILRFDTITRETPKKGIILGSQIIQYILNQNKAACVDIRSVITSGFISLNIAGSIKHILSELNTSFIYTTYGINSKILIPTKINSFHFNMGFRSTIGIDYLLTKNLSLGCEFYIEPNIMFMIREIKFEFSIGSIFSVGIIL